MGRRKEEEHLIGDPVDPPIEEGCLKSFNQYSRTKDYLKRTLVIMFTAIIVSMLISLAFIFLIDPEGVKFVLPIFLLAMVLIICISLPIGLKMGLKLMGKMKDNRVDAFKDHLTIFARYIPIQPSVLLKIPMKNIKGIRTACEDSWDTKRKSTSMFFRFFYRTPNPGVGDLYSTYSRKEDIIQIELNKPFLIERMMPPLKIENASFRSDKVSVLSLDIKKEQHDEFLEQMKKCGVDILD